MPNHIRGSQTKQHFLEPYLMVTPGEDVHSYSPPATFAWL